MNASMNATANEAASSFGAPLSAAVPKGMFRKTAALAASLRHKTLPESAEKASETTNPARATEPSNLISALEEPCEGERINRPEKRARELGPGHGEMGAFSVPSDFVGELRVATVVPMRMGILADRRGNPGAGKGGPARRFFEHLAGLMVGVVVFLGTSVLWSLLIALTWIMLAVAFNH